MSDVSSPSQQSPDNILASFHQVEAVVVEETEMESSNELLRLRQRLRELERVRKEDGLLGSMVSRPSSTAITVATVEPIPEVVVSATAIPERESGETNKPNQAFASTSKSRQYRRWCCLGTIFLTSVLVLVILVVIVPERSSSYSNGASAAPSESI